MKSRINLYVDHLKPQPERATIATGGWLLLISCLVIIAVFLQQRWQLQQREQMITELQSQALQQQSVNNDLIKQLSELPTQESLLVQLDKAKQELRHKQVLLHFLQTSYAENHYSPSIVMQHLAAKPLAGLWLNEFKLGQEEVTFLGEAISAEALPVWLASLQQDEVLAGQNLHKVQIKKSDRGLLFTVSNQDTVGEGAQ